MMLTAAIDPEETPNPADQAAGYCMERQVD